MRRYVWRGQRSAGAGVLFRRFRFEAETGRDVLQLGIVLRRNPLRFAVGLVVVLLSVEVFDA